MRPLISPDIRAASTARSYGLPLHLDLAVGRFLEIRRTREPLPQDFDHAFPALLARVLSDLTPRSGTCCAPYRSSTPSTWTWPPKP